MSRLRAHLRATARLVGWTVTGLVLGVADLVSRGRRAVAA